MLGFKFSSEPTVSLQLERIARKANKRFFLLLRHKKAGLPMDRLKDLYTSVIRSCLEYSSPVYHSQLNQHQIDMLEGIQKRCLRAIYGYNNEYQTLLIKSGLTTLEDRHIKLFAIFANKTVKNPKYSH